MLRCKMLLISLCLISAASCSSPPRTTTSAKPVWVPEIRAWLQESNARAYLMMLHGGITNNQQRKPLWENDKKHGQEKTKRTW
jgi:hypothetical protein